MRPLQAVTGWRGIAGPNLRRVLVWLRPQRAKLALIAVLGIIFVPASLIEPWLILYLFDRILMAQRPDLLLGFVTRVFPFFALAIAVEFLLTYTVLWMARDLHGQVKAEQLDNLLAKGINFFRNNASGKLIFSFFNDSSQIGSLLSVGFVNALLNIFFVIVRTGILLWVDWTLTLAYLAVLPFQFAVTWKIMKIAMQLEIRMKERDEQLTDRIESLVRGAVAVKGFGYGAPLASIWRNIFEGRLDLDLRNMVWKQLGSIGLVALQAMATFAALFMGVYRIADGLLTVGVLMAFMAIAGRLAPSLLALVSFGVSMQEAFVNVERFYRIHDAPDESDEFAHSVVTARSPEAEERIPVLDSHTATIALRSVAVDHGSGPPVRVPCDFEIQRGDRQLWYGPNGSGKTSLALALAGLVPHLPGSIVCGGVPLARLDLAGWRERVLYLGSDVYWPERPMRENFTNSASEAVDAKRMSEALEMSTADQVLQSLPKGLETVLSDDGHVLSRGENQRLLLALALYRRPDVLILDEALSNVAPPTAARAFAHMSDLSWKCAVCLVSQRAEDERFCSQVIRFAAAGSPA